MLVATVSSEVCAGLAWTSDLQLGLRSGYDGNLRLNVIDELNTPLIRAHADWSVTAQAQRTSLELFTNVVQAEYPDLEADVNTDFGLNLGVRHDFETWGIFANVGRQRINTLANALDDAGLLDDTVQREQESYSVGLNWQFAERGSLAVQTLDQSVEYPNSNSLSDFDFSVQSAEFDWQANENRVWTATLDYSDFETEFSLNRSTTRGASIGLSQALSSTLDASLSVGRNWTDTTRRFFFGPFFFDVDSSSADYRLDASLRKRWATDVLIVSAGQQVQPAGNGILTTRRYVSASWRHRFSERLSLRLATLLRDFDEVNDAGGQENDRTAARYTLALDAEITPTWSWRVEASHRSQAFDARDDVARGDRFFVSVIYRFVRGDS